MSLPKYGRYKESGISWIEEIPEHWNSLRIKTLFEIMKRPPNALEGVVTAFRDGEVTLRSNRRTDGFTNSLQEIGYQGVRRGDLVIHAMDAFAGAIGVSDSDGKSTPVYSVCKPREGLSNAKYYGRLLRQMALSGFVESLGKGVRERSTEFRWAEAGNVYLPVPPVAEQTAIAAFLDRETAKIDALISGKKKLITLLTEKRQTTIAHAVTRGLNPNAQMKNSGVAWLGDVPAHWRVLRLRFIVDIETGNADTANATDEGEFPFFVRSQTVERIGKYTHDCEAVLTAGDGAGVGKVFHHFKGKFCAHQRVYIFKNFRGVSGKWFFEYLRALFYRVVLEGTAKSTVDSLRRPMIADFPVTIPSAEEMTAIERHIELESFKFERLIQEAERGIDLLKERRTALIAAAVTGQIDVRSATLQAIDESPEAIAA